MGDKRSAGLRSDSVKNMSAYADQNHAPSLTDVRLEYRIVEILEVCHALHDAHLVARMQRHS